jgi:hypothetical protein
MKPRSILCLLACALLALCCACGVPGAPQPPSLKLPRPVRDLRAERKGDKVTLTWTAPRVTTDQQGIRQPGVTRVCRSLGTEPMSACTPVGEVPGAQAAPGKPASFVDTLAETLQQQRWTGVVTYAVDVQNADSRSAGLSNQVQISLAPALRAPVELKAEVTAQGVELRWRGDGYLRPGSGAWEGSYRVYREPLQEGARRVALGTGEMDNPQFLNAVVGFHFLDKSAEWENKYRYIVVPITRYGQGEQAGEFEGEEAAVEVFAHDVFPPAVPTGLEAVYTPVPQQAGFIDLTWAPDTEADLAGYSIYRHEEGAAAVKVSSELVKTPAFRDRNVVTGHRYFYSVSAVDLRGNESARSGEASEAVPQ